MYDVSYPSNPVLLSHIDIVADSDSSNFTQFDLDTYIFPYNASSETRGCASHIYFVDDTLYIVTSNMGVYKVQSSDFIATSDAYDISITGSSKEPEIPNISGYSVEQYLTGSQVYAVDLYNEYLVVACGAEGVHLLNEELECISTYQTDGFVKDIKVYGDYIFTAEADNGLGIYQIIGDSIEYISDYKDNRYDSCFGSIFISEDGNYIVAETTSNSFCVLDISDIFNIQKIVNENQYNTGLIYYRSISTGMTDSGIFSIMGSRDILFISTRSGELEITSNGNNSIYGRSNGAAAYGDYLVFIGNNGYYYYDTTTGEFSKKVKIEGITFEGKICINGDLMVISTENTGEVMFVNVENIDSPTVIADFSVDGNPDVAFIAEDYILIPCRYGGLLKIVKE